MSKREMTSIRENALTAFQGWYDTLPRTPASGNLPIKGTIAVCLFLLERLKANFDLQFQAHLAPGGAQIQGISTPKVQQILACFGEQRPFLKVAGRTNRGGLAPASDLLNALAGVGLEQLSIEERKKLLTAMQEVLVQAVRDHHGRERLKPVYDPSHSTRRFIAGILDLADESGKRGAVAQYLVGAKLALRFPNESIRNEVASAADDPTRQSGDFVLGDVTFHVTVAPQPGHYDKCRRNLDHGRRVFLLVPNGRVVGARENAEGVAPGRIAVESIESFVAQNIEEIAGFDGHRVSGGLARLLEKYNERVDQIENDKSLLIELPPNLGK